MTTQLEMKTDVRAMLALLQRKANSKGLIYVSQEAIAKELGYSFSRVHRLVQKLVADGNLRLSGGGRNVKVIQLINSEMYEDVIPEPILRTPLPPDRTEIALALLESLEAAMGRKRRGPKPKKLLQ